MPTLSPVPSTEARHREILRACETWHLRNHFPDLGRTCHELSRIRRGRGARSNSHPFRPSHVVGRRYAGLFALGAYLGRNLGNGLALVFFILAFACLIGMRFAVRSSAGLSVASCSVWDC